MRKPKEDRDHVTQIASYYGFKTINVPSIKKEDAPHVKSLSKQNLIERESLSKAPNTLFKLEEKLALLRVYGKKTLETLEALETHQPTMLITRKAPKKNIIEFSLDIIGTTKSIAEAILIKTTQAILEEEGYNNISIVLNTIGDREAIHRFERELWNYYKKKLNELKGPCKDCVRRNPITHVCEDEKCIAIRRDAPQPMAFLSESARTHFREVLEFIETMEIPYQIDPTLFGHRDCFAHTLFEIHLTDAQKNSQLCGFGFRYSPLSRKLGFKKDIPAISLSCSYQRLKNSVKLKKPKSAQFYFIHLGFEAKLKSLKIIESLRKWGIPILHALAGDQITGQISSAEHMDLPFIIIMGQKEAMENNVVVRNTETRVQETVPLKELPHYLITIHKSVRMLSLVIAPLILLW